MLDQVLEEYWLSPNEAKAYLTTLQLGTAPISSIARYMKLNRVTVYSVLKNLVKKWVALEIPKKWTTYYSVISPENLVQKMKEKYLLFEKALPEFLAMASKFNTKPKVQFYEGLEGLKYVYEQIILSGSEMDKGESFLTFVGTTDIDPGLQKYLVEDFVPWRLKHKTKTKAIISKQSIKQKYSQYNKNKHEHLIIDDPIFDIANEIVVHGKDRVSLLMYSPNEMSALVIYSQTLHNWLKSMFNLIWKAYKK
jgi:predicted DNA-binding transcriptional regulator